MGKNRNAHAPALARPWPHDPAKAYSPGSARDPALLAAEALVTVALLWAAFALHPLFASPPQETGAFPFIIGPLFLYGGAFVAILLGVFARHALEALPLFGSAPWQPFAPSHRMSSLPRFRLRPGPGPMSMANARLIALGFRDYVLVDQGLLAQYPPEEWRAILHHEMGHHTLGHGRAQFWINTVQGASLGLILAGWFYAARSQALGLSWQPYAILAFLLLIGWRQMDILSRSLRHFWAWKWEMAADFWASEAGHGPALIQALRRFAIPEPEQAGFLDRLRLGQNQTHPPISCRLNALQGIKGASN